MPKYPAFIGGSAVGESVIMESARTVNWYPEFVESGAGKNPLVLLPTPGLAAVWDTGYEQRVRALAYKGNRLLTVVGTRLYELHKNFTLSADGTSVTTQGTTTLLGTVAADEYQAQIEYNGVEYFIVSGGHGYLLSGNTLTAVSGTFFQVGYDDGYFLSVEPTTRHLKISDLYDGSSWAALDYTTKEDDPGDIVGMIVDHGDVQVLGTLKSQSYYNSGNADFPFTRIPSSRMEQGCSAPYSLQRIDNTTFWIGNDEHGSGVVWRAQGFTPTRISSHSVERDIQALHSDIDEVSSWVYQHDGHPFYCITLPSKTWVYDVATSLWHERIYWNSTLGIEESHRAETHVSAWGYHFVGDKSSGEIHLMASNIGDDDGDEIRRVRRGAHLYHEDKRLFISEFSLHLETGVGLSSGQGSDPLIMMRYSWDGGKTWSSQRSRSSGAIGRTTARIAFNRLGSGYDFVPEIVATDPIPWRIVDAFYEGNAGAH
jgi:hypothetical protein